MEDHICVKIGCGYVGKPKDTRWLTGLSLIAIGAVGVVLGLLLGLSPLVAWLGGAFIAGCSILAFILGAHQCQACNGDVVPVSSVQGKAILQRLRK